MIGPAQWDWKVSQATDFSEADFESLHLFAKITADHRRMKHPRINMVCDRIIHLPEHTQKGALRALNNGTVGIAWPWTGIIWLDTTKLRSEVMITALHEISHIYSNSDCHGPAWRKFFGMALGAFHHHLGMADEDVRRQIEYTVRSYRRYRYRVHPEGSVGRVREYNAGIREETDKIMRSSRPLWTKTAGIL